MPSQAITDVIAERKRLTDWVVQTCLLFGSSVSTSYQVAGLFIAEIERLDRKEGKDA